jgi:hypothetical protein
MMSDRVFDPSSHLTKVSGSDYLGVQWRLVWFRDKYPHGRITAEHVTLTDQLAIFRAEVTAVEDGEILGSATGYGSETKGDFKDFIEKAETKAIGRALAALGFGTQFAPDLAEGDRIVDTPVTRQEPRDSTQRAGKTYAPSKNIDAPRATQSAAEPEIPAERQRDGEWIHWNRKLHKAVSDRGDGHEGVHALVTGTFDLGSVKDATANQLRSIYGWVESNDRNVVREKIARLRIMAQPPADDDMDSTYPPVEEEQTELEPEVLAAVNADIDRQQQARRYDG